MHHRLLTRSGFHLMIAGILTSTRMPRMQRIYADLFLTDDRRLTTFLLAFPLYNSYFYPNHFKMMKP